CGAWAELRAQPPAGAPRRRPSARSRARARPRTMSYRSGESIQERSMDSWDIRSLDIEPHHPQVLRSDDETRVIALNLPGGEELQDHQVHERAYLVVVE